MAHGIDLLVLSLVEGAETAVLTVVEVEMTAVLAVVEVVLGGGNDGDTDSDGSSGKEMVVTMVS